MKDFVDLSSNNGTLNLAAYARTGATIIGLKAIEGESYHWPMHRQYSHQAHDLGLAVWHYDFLRGPNEADEFMTEVGPVFSKLLGDRLVLDYEAAATPADAVPVMEAVERAYGAQVVYGGASKIAGTGLVHRPGWAWWQAAYSDVRPPAPAGWPQPIAWQYTQTGRSPVAAHFVDISHYYGGTSHPKPPAPVEDDMACPATILRAESDPTGARHPTLVHDGQFLYSVDGPTLASWRAAGAPTVVVKDTIYAQYLKAAR